MHYAQFNPRPALSPYVQCYWTLSAPASAEQGTRERILPDGSPELIFHFGDLFRKYASDGTAHIQPRSFIHGQLSTYTELEASGNTDIFSIRFHPHGLSAFVGEDLQAFSDRHIDLEDLFGPAGARWQEQMWNVPDIRLRIAICEAFLLQRLQNQKIGYPLVQYSLDLIRQSGGRKSIDELAAGLYIGRRQLERQFLRQVGMSPKLFSRITRFQQTLQRIESGHFEKLNSLAFDQGYYDQTHFIKDFKAFAGMNPGQYFDADLEWARHFVRN